MGEPSLGSRWTKPSTLSILPARADEGCMVRKSPMVGRFSKCGMWRFVKGTEFLAGGPAWAGREDPRRTRKISRSARECLLDWESSTASLQDGASDKEVGQGIVVSSLPTVLTTAGVQELAVPNRDFGYFDRG